MTEKCVKREQLSTIKVVPQSLTRVPSVRPTLDLRVLLREGESRRSGPRRRAEQDHDHLERQQADGAAGTFSYRHFPSKNPSLLFTLSFFLSSSSSFFFLSFFRLGAGLEHSGLGFSAEQCPGSSASCLRGVVKWTQRRREALAVKASRTVRML